MTPEKLQQVFDGAMLLWHTLNVAAGGAAIWALTEGMAIFWRNVTGREMPGRYRYWFAYAMTFGIPVIIYAALVDGGLVQFDMKGAGFVLIASLKLANTIHQVRKDKAQRAEEARKAAQESKSEKRSAAAKKGAATRKRNAAGGAGKGSTQAA